MRPFFENNVLQQQPFKPMIIVVDTTKAGSASNTFVLPIIKDVTEVVKIYWGDDTNSTGVNGDNTHVYAASGIYTIKIESKIFGGLYFNGSTDVLKIMKISSYGDGLIRLSSLSFFSCANLTINGNISGAKILATSYTYCFGNCIYITSAPFFNLSRATNVSQMFRNNSALVSVPFYDFSNVTNASGTFYGCASLTTVPLFNLSNCTNATNMFFGVTLTTTSYSDFLINLATLPLQSGVSFHGGNSKYNTAGGVARAYLISNFGWTITDGGAA
jgi:hypothetical protein